MPAAVRVYLNPQTVVPTALVIMLGVAAVLSGDWSPWVEASVGTCVLLLVVFTRHAHPLAGGWRSPAVWFFVFLLIASVSLLWSQQLYASMRTLTYLFIGVATFLAARAVPRAYHTALLRWVYLVGVGSAAYALVNQFVLGEDRTGGLLGNANALGALLILMLPLGVYLALQSSGRWRFVLWASVVVVASALLRTFSYTAWFGLIVAAAVGLVLAGRRVLTLRRVLWTLSVVLLLLVSAVTLRSIQQHSVAAGVRLDRVVSSEHLRFSFEQRWRFVRSATAMVVDYPFTGVGLGAFQVSYPRYAHTPFEQPRYAHNAYLEIAAEAGVPAALTFLGALVCIAIVGRRQLRSLREEHPYLPWLALSVGGSAVAAAVDFGWHFPAVWVCFFLLAGLLVHEPPQPNRRYGMAISTLLVFIAVVVLVRGFGVAYAWTYFERADRAFADGDAERAIPAYEQGLRYDPDPTRRNQLAEALWVSNPGDTETLQRARVQLQRAIAWAPTNYFSQRLLGRVEFSDRNFAAAERAFRDAVEYDQAFHLDIAGEYANFLIQQQRLADALGVVDRALAVYPEGTWSGNPSYANDITNMRHLREGIERQLQAL